MSDWIGILWLFVLLIANAFFVGAEFAVISARRSQIEPLAEQGSRSAKTALWAMEHATLMLAMSQLGITICSLLILNVSEPAIHHLLEGPLHLTGWSEAVVSTVAFAITLVLVSYLHVVFGEMVPKNLSFSVPDRAVLLLAPPLVFLARLFRPIIVALNATANGVLRVFGVEPKNEANSTFTLEEVQTIVDQSRREGVLDDASGTLTAAFEFTTKRVHDVAVPMSGLVSLPPTATPGDIERAVARHGFSRYVIVGDDGEPDGYVHLKDVIDLDEDEFDDPLPAKRVRRLVSIYDGTDLEDALATMRRLGTHVARAFDEDGTTTGVIFLEDIIEELVGEVQDATRRG
jgi:CBS domain containing-hemolysin-like protein